jgi:hypothetical protein
MAMVSFLLGSVKDGRLVGRRAGIKFAVTPLFRQRLRAGGVDPARAGL